MTFDRAVDSFLVKCRTRQIFSVCLLLFQNIYPFVGEQVLEW